MRCLTKAVSSDTTTKETNVDYFKISVLRRQSSGMFLAVAAPPTDSIFVESDGQNWTSDIRAAALFAHGASLNAVDDLGKSGIACCAERLCDNLRGGINC